MLDKPTCKKPAAMDIHVGARIRMRRTMLRMSQETLGQQIKVTFQQVQKYEKGANRVGASRLQQIADALSTTPSWFFEDAPGLSSHAEPATDENAVMDFIRSREGLELSRAFSSLDILARRKLLGVVKAVASLTGKGDQS